MIPTLILGQLGLGRALVAPATAYDSGDRTASITVTSNITPDGGTINNLVDGGTAANSSDAIDMPGTGSTAIPNGAYFRFTFATKQYFTKVRLRFSTGANMGAWVVKVGNGTPSLQVGSYTWNSDDLEVILSGLDPEGYTDIQLEKDGAGTNYTNSWFTEVNFERADGAV
jgi:hypothetical protein